MALKKFNAKLTQVLNGVDTYTFSHVCSSASVASRYAEGATISVEANGVFCFGGHIKSTNSERAGFIKHVSAESHLSTARDQDLQETRVRNPTKTSVLLQDIAPEGVNINYVAEIDPPIKYALRSGSILTHLNTMCAMNSLNWRSECVSATQTTITISDTGAIAPDVPVFVEHVDAFNLKIDKSLFKQPTRVTAIGVEPEVAGYTCVADLITATSYFLLDSDDGEVYDDEIPMPGDTYEYLSDTKRVGRFLLDYGADLKGWEVNTHFLVNGECISYTSKSGNTLLGIKRNQWGLECIEQHFNGDTCALMEKLQYVPKYGVSTTISPATDLFKIGSEIIRIVSADTTCLTLATIDPNTMDLIGRGLKYDKEFATWVGDPDLIYSHKRGTPIVPYYPDRIDEQVASTLAVTIHGKGVINKDGIDKLAWGALTNLQNGILSGGFTYRAGDFGDTSIKVGQRIQIQTAPTKTGSASGNVIVPATSYDALIYSITREQNKLIHVEFGNVVPEVLTLLKSGEYAMQAAIRKQETPKTIDTINSSLSGKVAQSTRTGKVTRLVW